jgi:hypothetical protein
MSGSTMVDGSALVVAFTPPTKNIKIKTQTVRDLKIEYDMMCL